MLNSYTVYTFDGIYEYSEDETIPKEHCEFPYIYEEENCARIVLNSQYMKEYEKYNRTEDEDNGSDSEDDDDYTEDDLNNETNANYDEGFEFQDFKDDVSALIQKMSQRGRVCLSSPVYSLLILSVGEGDPSDNCVEELDCALESFFDLCGIEIVVA